MNTQAAIPGTSIPTGAQVSPGGAQGLSAMPPGVSSDPGNVATVGSDGRVYVPPPLINGFMDLSAAYTATLSDRGKLFICTGGSWTLTLPAPSLGLQYQIRNAQGITGVTGSITIQASGGTIDGSPSINILPGQACSLITDGTNWATWGLQREVIIGVQNITSSQPFGSVLLPVGYQQFELNFAGILVDTTDAVIHGRASTDGGATWQATNYFNGTLAGVAGSVIFVDSSPATWFDIVGQTAQSSPSTSFVRVFPGSAAPLYPTVQSYGGSRSSSNQRSWLTYCMLFFSGPINALQYYATVGNILRCSLTVKGVA